MVSSFRMTTFFESSVYYNNNKLVIQLLSKAVLCLTLKSPLSLNVILKLRERGEKAIFAKLSSQRRTPMYEFPFAFRKYITTLLFLRNRKYFLFI